MKGIWARRSEIGERNANNFGREFLGGGGGEVGLKAGETRPKTLRKNLADE